MSIKNLRNTVVSVMEGVITIQVIFDSSGSREYTFLAMEEDGYEVGDRALSIVNNGGNDAWRVVEVVRVDNECDIDPDSDINYKFLVQKVDTDTAERREEKVEKTTKIFRQKQRAHQKKQMRAMLCEDIGEDPTKLLVMDTKNDNKEDSREDEIKAETLNN